MATMTTPEAEPKKEKAPAEGGGAEKKERKLGTDGASTPVISEAQKKQIIDQLRAAQQQDRQAEAGSEQQGPSMFHQTRDAIRGKVGKVLLAGAFLANPVVGATLYLGDKVARKTISKVPVVGQVYEQPRKLVVGAANVVREGVTSTIAAPAFVADRVQDVYQGITGIETTEARTIIGKVVEQGTEFIGGSIKFAAEKGKWLVEKSADVGQKAIEMVLKTVGSMLSIPYNMVHGAVDRVAKGSKWAAAAGPTGIFTSALTTALIGWGVWTWGAGFSSASYWPWLGGIISKAFGAARTALGI